MAYRHSLVLSRLALLMLGAAVLPLQAQELPSGAQVVAGDVAVTPGAGRLDVTQGTAHGIVDWGAFSIGAGGVVAFDNGAGATLNRVSGPLPSQLDGMLTATGSVYLVNPQGVVIGIGGVVNTGGRFVASTLDVSDADFLDGGDLSFAGSGGVVVNLGAVGSSGGDVALIAGDVLNQGLLAAPNGTVALAAGRQVLLRDAAVEGGVISVLVGGGDVTEAGAMRAAAAELRARDGNVYALAGNTDAVIEATGVERRAGRVFLTAPGGKVTAEKPVKASAAVTVTAQDIDLSGRTEAPQVIIKAEGETLFTGLIQTQGGFVELSGGHVTYDGRIELGGGTLLLDPENIEVSDLNDRVLSNSTLLTTADVIDILNGGDLILDTSSASFSDPGTIAVVSALTWDSQYGLTLMARGDVWILADVQNAGTGAVTAVAGWNGSTAYDRATFDAVALNGTAPFGRVLESTYLLFGSPQTAAGTIHVQAAFGSRFGATGLYGRDILVRGGGAIDQLAQVGYHLSGGGDLGAVAGDITVRARGQIEVAGGPGLGAYALVGHGGTSLAGDVATPTADLSGAILVQTSSNLLIAADEDSFGGSYAMIGHGSLLFGSLTEGDRSGAITVQVAGETSLITGLLRSNTVWIGHQTPDGAITAAPVTVTTRTIDTERTGATSSVVDLPMWADLTHGGEVRLTVTGSDLTVLGTDEPIVSEGNPITSSHDLIVQTSGALTLDAEFLYGNDGTGGLVLAGASVDNQAGAEAFLPIGGGWAIYSTRPDQDTQVTDTLDPAAVIYGVTFDSSIPFGPNADQGRVVYHAFDPNAQPPVVDEAPPVQPPVVLPPVEEAPTDPEPPALRGALQVIEPETTGQILEDIQSGTNFCRQFVDPEYAIDCLSDRLQSVADGISATGEYAEVRAALETAAADLHALAEQNASAALTRSVGRGEGAARPLTPVDAGRLADANAQAAAIISNTQLVLLRSTAGSDRRRVAFSQVGQVLGATTVLLRSS